MKHTVYEKMILADEALSRAEQIWLDSHLRICDACATLNRNWTEVRSYLQKQNPAPDAPGFLDRFKLRFATDRL